ncbi:ankyrin 3, node of Ranvier (ankyrin G) [Seminavis robusta]|uniref:Ankyrin 3, node of Ranvier (Ankyrin G) n=1 Tax=Seminavis robusta TaxID=568900 RepID=A0A9N8H3M3_9STRA|nr:ankyrin 3, node of Ranvier (ankyrin G) [Seminavis robusta]|eukprot:Sro30_g019380.1 ankyrin 3, node of Ranvier (ankyrin G) (871) ;mRNA; f:6783-9502
MDRPDDDEDLPVAMPLEDNGNDDEGGGIVAARLLHHRVVQQGTSYLHGLVQDPETTCLVGRGCQPILDRINEYPDDVHYTEPRTGRSVLHEACLRCSCLHVISAILAVNTGRAMAIDNSGNTPLHLLLVGINTHAMDTHALGATIDALLAENASVLASVCNRSGDTALHIAAKAPETMIPLECFRRILEANRTSATRVNNLNQTPLSLHCQRRQGSKEVAQMLLSAAPDAIRIVDTNGWSPLHYAAENANFELIKLLLGYEQTAASARTTSLLETPLHLLCRKNVGERHLPAIQSLLEADPRAVCARDAKKSQTPLHFICKNTRVPAKLVACIVDCFPGAASIPDNNNYLPIHHAAEVGAPTDVISCLLAAHPTGAMAKTRKNDSALSLACACNKSTETVALLIQANPVALTEKNHYGFVPLHCVCGAVQPRMGIVEEILKVCPKSVATKSNGGESPMHTACGNPSTCVGVIEILTTQYEINTDGSAELALIRNRQMTNKIGNTPLHNACFRGSPFEHIETLAMSNPQWVKCTNNAGYTPLQIMCKNARLQDRVITTFSRIGGPGVFSVVDMTGNTPLHSAMREETDIEALRCLIRAFPDALHMKTSYGDTPLHLACFRRVDPEVVREVALSYNEPPLLTPNMAGQTPIGIAMEEFQSVCRSGCHCNSKTDYKPGQKKAFDVLATLVKILHYGSSQHDDRDRMGSLLMACVSLHRRDVRLDPAFIRRAMHLYPEEARIKDEEGYPLHVEASIPVEKYTLLNGCSNGTCSNCHSRLGVLRMLFELYPDACRTRNNSGEFPLNLMIQNGRAWDQSFALVLKSFPQALHWSVGDKHKLFPLLLSKVSRECGIDTLHTLIRSRPDIALRSRSEE